MRNGLLLFTLPLLGWTAGLPAVAAEPPPLAQTSPFLPAPGAVAPLSEQPADVLEFASVSIGDLETLISLFDTKEKRSRWIAVGKKIDGIEVMSFDAAREQVVVRRGADLKVLTLRKPGKVIGAPAVNPTPAVVIAPPAPTADAATPVASAESKKPLTIAQQEEEARMFVADMLDIGMQHRKAYEEAQKKAAAEKAAGTNTTPSAPSAAPAPASAPSGG